VKEIFFVVEGRVQGVMFRQTFIRAAEQRGLTAGASNLPDRRVSCYLAGGEAKVEEVLVGLQSQKPLNSWGALITALTMLSPMEGIALGSHQVTTDNVDRFSWNPNVEMYL
jgi:acylphosphatase